MDGLIWDPDLPLSPEEGDQAPVRSRGLKQSLRLTRREIMQSESRDEEREPGPGQPGYRTDDLELVRGILARDPAATRAFGERMGCVPRFLLVRNKRMGGPFDGAELEDLAQEVVTCVWRQLDRYDGRARLETWVFQFCYLQFLRRLRSRRRRPRLFSVDDPDLTEEPEAAPDVRADYDEYELLYESLEDLADRDATVLRLKHFEDLTFVSIGERLGMSPNTAKTRYYRALSKLRARLGRSPDEPEARPTR